MGEQRIVRERAKTKTDTMLCCAVLCCGPWRRSVPSTRELVSGPLCGTFDCQQRPPPAPLVMLAGASTRLLTQAVRGISREGRLLLASSDPA